MSDNEAGTWTTCMHEADKSCVSVLIDAAFHVGLYCTILGCIYTTCETGHVNILRILKINFKN